jgi:glycosyl transferase family 25
MMKYQRVTKQSDSESNTDNRPVQTKITVISLASASDRRSRFRQRAQDASVPWSFYPACTGLHPALRYDEKAAIIAKGRPLSAGELGVYSSHYSAWEDFMSDDADQYVVLEDDVIVDWMFLNKLARVDLESMGINYLRLYYKVPVKSALVKENFIERARSIVELDGTAFGAQGYVITKNGARTFLDHCRFVTRPIDDEMERSWAHGQRNLSVFPFPIMEESAESIIGDSRFGDFAVPQHLKLRQLIHYRMDRLRRGTAKTMRRIRRFRDRQLSKT